MDFKNFCENQTPICPDCKSPMVLRTNRRDNSKFYGCSNYPNCRKTMGYNPNYQGNDYQQPQQQNYQQPRQTPQTTQNQRSWVYAKVAKKGDKRFPNIGKEIAVSQRSDKNWDYIVLDNPQDTGTILNNEIASGLIESLRNLQNNQPLRSTNPSLEDLEQQFAAMHGKDSPEKQSEETPQNASKKLIPQNLISQEQGQIDERFGQIMGSDQKQHIMISALAGTGKTTMLKHLAWKYGKPGQKWLYIVFNTKNKVEASEEFPSFVEVRTSNGFLGEVLNMRQNITRIGQTERMVQLQNMRKGYGGRLDKSRIVADSPQFAQVMRQLGLPDKIDTYEYGKIGKTLNSLLKSIAYSFKETVLHLTGLGKSFALDPRKGLEEGFDKILGSYDIDTDLTEIKERIAKYQPDFRSSVEHYLDEIFGYKFMSKNFTQEVIKATSWMMEQLMPNATKLKHGEGSLAVDLSSYRDFDDDLWYAATHADQLAWPHYDVVLADEVQDFNENQKIMLQKLAEAGAKIVAVGDANQCVIEGTEISIDENQSLLVEDIKKGQQIFSAQGGGKTTCAKVNDVFVREVDGLDVVCIKTKSGKTLTTTCDHTHFAGYQKSSEFKYINYLMYKEGMGYRTGITSNVRRGGLRINQERADKLWILEVSDNLGDAQYYEQYYSIKYSLPTCVFLKQSSQSYTQKHIDLIFESIDTEKNALQLLSDKNMFLNYPHHVPKCMNRKRYRNFNLTLCGDSRGTGLHRYTIAGSDHSDRMLINSIEKTRKSKRGWRIENSTSSMEEVYDLVENLASKMDINIIEKARLSNITLPYVPASHVFPGMSIYVQDKESIVDDVVVSVERIKYSGKVYDLNIGKYHNFVANGIVTHNSIYRFRGADGGAFNNLSNMLGNLSQGDGQVVYGLTNNFRSRPEILNFANEETHVKDLKSGRNFDDGKKGIVSKYEEDYNDTFRNIGQEVKENGGKVPQQTAFIARTNPPLVKTALKLLAQNIPFVIVGKDMAKELIGHIRKISNMKRLGDQDSSRELAAELSGFIDEEKERHHGKSTKKSYLQETEETTEALLAAIQTYEAEQGYGTIGGFKNWLSMRLGGLEVEENEKDLRKYRELVKNQNPIVLTTAHRSKGLEFSRVYILRYDQFPHPKAEREEDLQQEENMKYVALTRAQNELHILNLEDQPGYKDK